MKNVLYYEDELNDDFVKKNIDSVEISSDYKYIHNNIFWNFFSFVFYRIIATPIAYLYAKMIYDIKFENKELLKKYRKVGYFVYINHTQEILDTIIPTLGNFPKKSYIIAHPDNIYIPILGRINRMMGALPVPSDINTMKNFCISIEKIIKDKRDVIAIYPEAHVWPYYTKIRNYKDTSFKYPCKLNSPSFVFTTTYLKRNKKRPRIIVYIDGPFFPNDKLNIKKRQKELRDRIYECMNNRSKNSNIEYIKYIKVKDDEDD